MKKSIFYLSFIFTVFIFQSNLVVAQNYDWLLENDNSKAFHKKMKKWLKLDSTDLDRNFYISVYCYNQSVSLLNNIDYDTTSLDDLNKIQDKIMTYIDISKAHLDRVEDPDYRTADQYVMKNYIYFSKDYQDKAEEYKAKLMALNEEKRIAKPIAEM